MMAALAARSSRLFTRPSSGIGPTGRAVGLPSGTLPLTGDDRKRGMSMSDRERRGPRREWRGAEIVGIVLIAVGVVYLLGNLGIVRVAWSVIWPILIIVIGGVLLFGALRPSRRQASSAVVPRDGAARLELDLSVGAGRFRLEGGAPNGQLIDVTSTNDDIATRVDHAGDRAIVRLRQDFAWWPDAWRGGSEWTVRAASDVPTILHDECRRR